ncbi:hypothetical protein KSX_79000 [Ktedonospora formicarum]|uniref:Uncharacterized protein n=1 Tax=Ktedonospora formicarum TaxID=2778364 RepID=A0A8J3MUV0_9CHLR|nr:hypothetical protein KSX_79000 [Ktedonospora formicarum]
MIADLPVPDIPVKRIRFMTPYSCCHSKADQPDQTGSHGEFYGSWKVSYHTKQAVYIAESLPDPTLQSIGKLILYEYKGNIF